jgi:hypothetical protein
VIETEPVGFARGLAFDNRQDLLVTRAQLALELKVSLRMVDMMLADGEITPMRLRGKMVRFYLPDVLQELREKAKTSKRNCTRKLEPRMDTDKH